MSYCTSYRLFGSRTSAAFLGLLVLVHLGSAVNGECEEPKLGNVKWTSEPPPNDLGVLIANTKTVYKLGEEIAIDMTLTNRSNANLVVSLSNRLIPILVRAGGQTIESRQSAARHVVWDGGKARVPDSVISRSGPKDLAPGACIQERVSLVRFYDEVPREEGTFRFLLVRMAGDDRFQVSNMIDIKIVASEGGSGVVTNEQRSTKTSVQAPGPSNSLAPFR
jgi:hypothetical protein